MAKEIIYDVKVTGTEEAAKTLNDFEKEAESKTIDVKVDADTKKLEESLKNVQERSDQIEKIGQGIAGGFALATGVVGAFGESLGYTAEDIEQAQQSAASFIGILVSIKPVIEGVSAATKVFNAVLLANPIGLIVAAVAALIASLVALIVYWEEVSQAIRDTFGQLDKNVKIAIAVMFPLIGVVGYLAGAFDEAKLASDALAEAQRKAREAEVEAAEASIKASMDKIEAIEQERKVVEERYDKELRLAKAAGKDTYEIELQKLNDLIMFSKRELEIRQKVAQEAAKIYRSTFTKDFVKVYDEQAEIEKKKLANLEFDKLILQTEKATERRNAAKKDQDQELEDIEKFQQKKADIIDLYAKQNEEKARGNVAILGGIIDAEREAEAQKRRDIADGERQLRDEKIAIAQDTFSVVTSISDLLTAAGVENVGLQKTIALAQIAFDTAKAISGAIAQAQSVPFPANIGAIATGVAAVISGIAGAINALKSAPSVEGSGGGGGAGVAVPSLPRPDVSSQAFNRPAGPSNSGGPNRVFVVESDIKKTMGKVNVAESIAKFG